MANKKFIVPMSGPLGVGDDSEKIGNLSDLTTTDKTNIVSSINEVNNKIIPISQGGTGATTATAARTALEVMTGTSLWGNNSGTQNTITLSDIYSNYDFIYVQGIDNGVATCNIFRPVVTNQVSICNWYVTSTANPPDGIYYHGCYLTFIDTTVTFHRNGTYTVKKAANTADTWLSASDGGGISITKIIGYKY